MILTESIFMTRQHAPSHIRDHRLGLRNHRPGFRNHCFGIRNRHVGINRQLGLKGNVKCVDAKRSRLDAR